MTLPVPVPRPCPVCGAANGELIHDQVLAPVEGVDLHAGYRVLACADCGMVYADGLPAQDAFDHYYQATSRYEDAHRLGLPSPVDQARFTLIAEGLAPHLPRTAAIAEMGASTGGVLPALGKLGFTRLLGVDPSEACVRTGRTLHGLAMAQGTVFDPIPGGPYDLVIAVGVLEHIRDLDRAVASLGAALAPGGLLYLEVPDLEGFHLSNEAPFQAFATEHIDFFTRRSLANLMARHGFEPAFGGIGQRVHGGGSTMQVVAEAFRKGGAPGPVEPDRQGPAAARHYTALCEARAAGERARIRQWVQEGRPIAVWGAGNRACSLMATSDLPKVPVVAFLDSNPHLQGRSLGGVPIHPPAWLKQFSGPVLVASIGYASEILRSIREELGLANPVLTLDA